LLKRRAVRDPKKENVTFIGAVVVIIAVFFAVMNLLMMTLHPPRKSEVLQAGALQFSLGMPKLNYREGEPVALEMTVTNTSTEAVTLHFEQEREYDFAVERDLNLFFLTVPMSVWSYSASHPTAHVPHQRVLNPRQRLIYRSEWPQINSQGDAVGSGRYVIFGTVNLAGKDKQTLKLRGHTSH
jgi:hypothetical protein